MKVAALAYLPPPSAIGCVGAFRRNLAKYPAKHGLILFSEYDYGPDVLRMVASPEVAKNRVMANGQHNKFGVQNMVFLTAAVIAKRQGISHMLYLEADCRVGPDWDQIIWDEYFNLPGPCIAAGTLACYNPSAAGTEASLRWAQLVARNFSRNVPVATYGWKAAADAGPSCVFPNGAITVYDVAWLDRIFQGLNETYLLAGKLTAFDMAFGEIIWRKFGLESYDVLGFLESTYSGYGEALTTEAQRLEWLRSRKFVAVHQVKSDVDE